MATYSSNQLKHYNNLVSEIELTYHEASKKLGVSDSVCKILYTLCNGGEEYPLSKICKESGLTKQTVNSALRQLESDDLIKLTAADGKSKIVCLTEKGKVYVKNNALKIISIENEIFSSWSEKELSDYLRLTEKFLTELKEKISSI